MSKHILVISQYFYPENFRVNDLCKEWIKRGYKVTVITGIPNYPRGKFYNGYGYFKKRKEIYQGISIIRLPIIPRGKHTIILLMNYLSFVIVGYIWKSFTKIKADYTFVYEVSPMSQALLGVWFSRRRKIPLYTYVTDLWPENIQYIAKIENKLILRIIGKMVDYIYNKSNLILTSSQSFIDAIRARGVPKEKIKFWPQYAEDFYKPYNGDLSNITEIPQDDILNLIFAGNIGFAQGLNVLVNAAIILKKSNIKVRFNIVGDGRYKEKLVQNVISNNLEQYFNFIERQNPERIPLLLSVCDAALIILSKGKVLSMTLPAKTQSIMACKIPIIVSADGEIQKVVSDSQSGLVSNAGDSSSFAKNIINYIEFNKKDREIMANNALKYYKQNYDKKILLDKMDMWYLT